MSRVRRVRIWSWSWGLLERERVLARLSGLLDRTYRGWAVLIFGRSDVHRRACQQADRVELDAAQVQVTVLPDLDTNAWRESRQFFPSIQQFLSRWESP